MQEAFHYEYKHQLLFLLFVQVSILIDKVVENIKNGNIKEFVVMAGCDGRMKSREYYTEKAKNLPKDSVILTAGCAKYRYNKL